jgi:Peptidase M50B-like
MAPVDYSAQPVWRMRLVDLWWLAAYPVYQTLGTIRHEGSHALMAKAYGGTVNTIVLYPQTDLGRFTWGYTTWSGTASWVPVAAPYLGDLIWFVGFFLICTRLPIRNHLLWLNLVIVGLISPLLNSGVQWIAGFLNPAADVGQLRDALPDALVQLYFLVTLSGYVVGVVAVFWRVPRALLPDPAVS